MAKYTHPNFGDTKWYYLSGNVHGMFTLKEYRNGCYATQLTMTKTDANNMMERLIQNGWQESNR